MPLLNENGNPLPLQIHTEKDQKRIDFLKSLVYPEDEKTIFELGIDLFKEWLYGLEPREALILTSTHGINTRIKEKCNPSGGTVEFSSKNRPVVRKKISRKVIRRKRPI